MSQNRHHCHNSYTGSCLEELPLELVQRILRLLLWQPIPLDVRIPNKFSGQRSNFEFYTSILRTCGKLHKEGSRILYSNTLLIVLDAMAKTIHSLGLYDLDEQLMENTLVYNYRMEAFKKFKCIKIETWHSKEDLAREDLAREVLRMNENLCLTLRLVRHHIFEELSFDFQDVPISNPRMDLYSLRYLRCTKFTISANMEHQHVEMIRAATEYSSDSPNIPKQIIALLQRLSLFTGFRQPLLRSSFDLTRLSLDIERQICTHPNCQHRSQLAFTKSCYPCCDIEMCRSMMDRGLVEQNHVLFSYYQDQYYSMLMGVLLAAL